MGGAYDKNPFHFETGDLKRICLKIAGIPMGPDTVCDFPARNYTAAYMSMQEASGENSITQHQFANGDTVFGFNISRDQSSGSALQLLQTGTLDLELEFRQATMTGCL